MHVSLCQFRMYSVCVFCVYYVRANVRKMVTKIRLWLRKMVTKALMLVLAVLTLLVTSCTKYVRRFLSGKYTAPTLYMQFEFDTKIK